MSPCDRNRCRSACGAYGLRALHPAAYPGRHRAWRYAAPSDLQRLAHLRACDGILGCQARPGSPATTPAYTTPRTGTPAPNGRTFATSRNPTLPVLKGDLSMDIVCLTCGEA